MTWRAVHWHDQEIVERHSATTRWEDVPTTGALWVDVLNGEYRQTLTGRDNYWIHAGAFGSFNDPHNLHWYGGDPTAQARAWVWTPDGSVEIDARAPATAHVIRGVLLPDDVWERVRVEHSWRS